MENKLIIYNRFIQKTKLVEDNTFNVTSLDNILVYIPKNEDYLKGRAEIM